MASSGLLPGGPCDEWTRGLPEPMPEKIERMDPVAAERTWWALVGRLASACAEEPATCAPEAG